MAGGEFFSLCGRRLSVPVSVSGGYYSVLLSALLCIWRGQLYRSAVCQCDRTGGGLCAAVEVGGFFLEKGGKAACSCVYGAAFVDAAGFLCDVSVWHSSGYGVISGSRLRCCEISGYGKIPLCPAGLYLYGICHGHQDELPDLSDRGSLFPCL